MPKLPLCTLQRVDGKWIANESAVQIDTETGDLHAPGGVLTADGGIAVPMINATGAPSVKGMAVTVGSAADNSFVAEVSGYGIIGYVQEDGVPDGQPCLVGKTGKVWALLKDGTAGQRGYLLRVTDVPGRVEAIVPPAGLGSQAQDEHFKEGGHCLEDKPAGVDVLVLASLHLN
ncbi:hypothetical protein [Pseudomonas sp.]|uniref:hypothetical protein n=1 Tax=Pseudomonas sp. TaxID=306 RepID=UPI003D09FEEA